MLSIRWQDWVYVLLGCWLVVSPLELGYLLNNAATANSWGVGGVIIMINLISVSGVFGAGQVILNILLGIWLIFSPYPLDFILDKNATTDTMVVGAIIVVFSVWEIYVVTKRVKR